MYKQDDYYIAVILQSSRPCSRIEPVSSATILAAITAGRCHGPCRYQTGSPLQLLSALKWPIVQLWIIKIDTSCRASHLARLVLHRIPKPLLLGCLGIDRSLPSPNLLPNSVDDLFLVFPLARSLLVADLLSKPFSASSEHEDTFDRARVRGRRGKVVFDHPLTQVEGGPVLRH
jgi:hypothetical protein